MRLCISSCLPDTPAALGATLWATQKTSWPSLWTQGPRGHRRGRSQTTAFHARQLSLYSHLPPLFLYLSPDPPSLAKSQLGMKI